MNPLLLYLFLQTITGVSIPFRALLLGAMLHSPTSINHVPELIMPHSHNIDKSPAFYQSASFIGNCFEVINKVIQASASATLDVTADGIFKSGTELYHRREFKAAFLARLSENLKGTKAKEIGQMLQKEGLKMGVEALKENPVLKWVPRNIKESKGFAAFVEKSSEDFLEVFCKLKNSKNEYQEGIARKMQDWAIRNNPQVPKWVVFDFLNALCFSKTL